MTFGWGLKRGGSQVTIAKPFQAQGTACAKALRQEGQPWPLLASPHSSSRNPTLHHPESILCFPTFPSVLLLFSLGPLGLIPVAPPSVKSSAPQALGPSTLCVPVTLYSSPLLCFSFLKGFTLLAFPLNYKLLESRDCIFVCFVFIWHVAGPQRAGMFT